MKVKLPKDRLFHIYIPEIEGKEKRKKARSKAGLLGVEGMTREVLVKALSPFVEHGTCEKKTSLEPIKKLTKLDLFRDGLSGGSDSSKKRGELAWALGFPANMSANALIEAINLTVGYEGYERALEFIFCKES